MRNLWIPLVAVIVLLAASTASADWTYTATTGWAYAGPAVPAPTVYYSAPAPSVYVYRAPVVAPAPVVYRSPVIYRSPFVVRSRVHVPGRVFRRSVWTVW